MDKLDKALGIEEKTEQEAVKPVPSLHVPSYLPAVLVVGAIVIVVLIGLLIWKSKTPTSVQSSLPAPQSDTDVKELTVAYERMKTAIKSGEIKGKIVGKNWTGRTVSLCDVAEGKIVKEKGVFYLECLKKDVKLVSVVNDNSFTVRLAPGNYFINAQLESGEMTTDLPARISVRAGEVGSVEIGVK